MRRFALAALLLLAAAAAFAAEPDFEAILQEIDRMGSFDDTDFSATFTVVAEKPNEQPDVFKIRVFRRDREKKLVILFLEPPVQKGQGYLQIGDNLWFYDPESRKFSHSSFKENLQSSDAKSSDLRASSLAKDYSVAGYTEDTLGRYPVYIVNLSALNDEVTYPRIKLWIRRDNNLVLKVEDYSLSDRLMRTAYYPSYVEIGGRFIPARMLFVDNLKPGEKTQITMQDPSLASLPDTVFTKAFLERVNR